MNEFQKIITSQQDRTDLCVEVTAVRVAELLAKQLAERGLTRSEFAKMLDVTPGRVTQMLDGDSNLQIRTIAKALAVLDLVMDISVVPVESLSCPERWEDIQPHSACGRIGSAAPTCSTKIPTTQSANSSYALAA